MAFTWVDIVLAIVAVYILLKYWYNSKVDRIRSYGLNFIQPTFLLGNSRDTLIGKRRYHAVSNDLYRLFTGDRYAVLFEMATPTIVIRDLELIKEVTIKSFDHFPNHRAIVDTDKDVIFGLSLFSLRDNAWKKMRASVSPALTSNRMKRMSVLLIKAADQMRQHCQDTLLEMKKSNESPVLDMKHKSLLLAYFVDLTAMAGFGLEMNSFKGENHSFLEQSKRVATLDYKKALKFYGFAVVPKLMKMFNLQLINKDTVEYFQKIVIDTISYREKNGIKAVDFLDLMIDMKKGVLRNKSTKTKSSTFVISDWDENRNENDIKKTNWSDKELTSQATTFMLGGLDSGSSAMEILLFELAKNPDVQKKLQDEIDEALDIHKEISYDMVNGMQYLNMVVAETMRKYGTNLERVCSKDYDLGPIRPGGKSYTIKKGDGIMIPGYSIQRDPKYFPNPLKFDPERFSKENRHNIVPYSYMPFGIGPRICVGFRFSELAIKLATVSLISTLAIVPTKDTPEVLEFCPKSLIVRAVNANFGLKLRQV